MLLEFQDDLMLVIETQGLKKEQYGTIEVVYDKEVGWHYEYNK